MPIRPSTAAELRQLVAALDQTNEVQRESAIARLAVLGPRAADHLLRAYSSAEGPRSRAGMLRALEASGDPRVVSVARAALEDPSPEVASTAISVLRNLLSSAHPDAARDALDALVAVAVDRARPGDRRLAAFDALKDLPASTAEPIRRRLAEDSDPDVRERARTSAPPAPETLPSVWSRALEGQLPASPDVLKKAVAVTAASTRLTQLQRLVDVVRAQEAREEDSVRRAEWRAVRGALHQALATRGSRLALYDLRDSLLEHDRLPVAFLAALEDVGDASCLEPLAAAYDASTHGGDPWWREHLAAAFRAIVHREGLTRRHAVVKRAMTRWPQAATDLMARS